MKFTIARMLWVTVWAAVGLTGYLYLISPHIAPDFWVGITLSSGKMTEQYIWGFAVGVVGRSAFFVSVIYGIWYSCCGGMQDRDKRTIEEYHNWMKENGRLKDD